MGTSISYKNPASVLLDVYNLFHSYKFSLPSRAERGIMQER